MPRLAYEPLNMGDVVQRVPAVDVRRLKYAYFLIGVLVGFAIGLYYAAMHPPVGAVDQGCELASASVTCTRTTTQG